MFEIFVRRSSLSDDAEQASRKMVWWSTAAGRAGALELDEHVSLRLFGTCMSCMHRRHLTGGRSSAHRSAPRHPLVRWRGCVHDMHVPNSLVDTRSSSPRAPAQVAAVGHGSRRGFFGIVTQTKRRTILSNIPEIGKTRRGWQGMIKGSRNSITGRS